MDSSRESDLYRLDKVRKDHSKSRWARWRADLAIKAITAQMNDRRLTAMRWRLIGATQAGDDYEVWKIENLMRDYLKEEKLEVKYYE